jgi:hypothetical protein
MLGGGVRFCQWSVAPLRFVFLATWAMPKRRRYIGIISPSFFRSPMAIYSDVNGEAGETCPGVEGRRIGVFFK